MPRRAGRRRGRRAAPTPVRGVRGGAVRRLLLRAGARAARPLRAPRCAADSRAEQAKDVEAQLWKNVFYKFIEDFRVRIRKYSAAVAAGEPQAEESVSKARRRFRTRAARLLFAR